MGETNENASVACTASLEHFSGWVYAVRVHEYPHGRRGDPWAYALTLRDDRPGFLRRLWLRLRGRPAEEIAFLCLTHEAPTFEQVEAMRVALLAAGYEWAVWERRKNGRVRLFRLWLSRPVRRPVSGQTGGPAPSDEGGEGRGGSSLLPGQEAVREALADGELNRASRHPGPFVCESCLEVTGEDDHAGDAVLGGGVNYAPVCRRCAGEFYVAKCDRV
jgi:hypothetical protein